MYFKKKPFAHVFEFRVVLLLSRCPERSLLFGLEDVSKSLIFHGQSFLSVIFFLEIESVINRQNIDKCVFESNLRHHKDWFQEKQAIPHHKIQLVYKSK